MRIQVTRARAPLPVACARCSRPISQVCTDGRRRSAAAARRRSGATRSALARSACSSSHAVVTMQVPDGPVDEHRQPGAAGQLEQRRHELVAHAARCRGSSAAGRSRNVVDLACTCTHLRRRAWARPATAARPRTGAPTDTGRVTSTPVPSVDAAPFCAASPPAGCRRCLASLPVFLLGGLAVLVRDDLGFSEVQLGLAASTFFTVAALTAVPAGRVAARIGRVGGDGHRAPRCRAVALLVMAVAHVVRRAAARAGPRRGGQLPRAARHERHARRGRAEAPAGTRVRGQAGRHPGSDAARRLLPPARRADARLARVLRRAAVLAVVYVLLAPRTGRRTGTAGQGAGQCEAAAVRASSSSSMAAALGAAAVNGLAAFLVESAVRSGCHGVRRRRAARHRQRAGRRARVLVGWLADRRTGGHLRIVTAMMATGAVGMALFATGTTAAFVAGTALVFALGWSWPGLHHLRRRAAQPLRARRSRPATPRRACSPVGRPGRWCSACWWRRVLPARVVGRGGGDAGGVGRMVAGEADAGGRPGAAGRAGRLSHGRGPGHHRPWPAPPQTVSGTRRCASGTSSSATSSSSVGKPPHRVGPQVGGGGPVAARAPPGCRRRRRPSRVRSCGP